MNRLLLAGALTGISALTSAQTLQDAIQLSDREQFERATVTFRQLLKASPSDGATWYYFGENYYRNEQLDSAEYCYRHGADVNPRYPMNKAGIGKILMVQGKRAEAQAQFDDAIATVEDKASKSTKDMKAATYREVARGLGAGNKPDIAAAMGMLNKALELAPADPECFMLKGDLLLQSGSYDASEAVAAFKKAAELLPAAARPVAQKARMYYRAKSYEAAIAEFDQAISIDPGFAPAYSGRAEAYFMTKQYDKATADYDKYLSLNSGSRSARVRYAKFLFLTKKYDEALREIDALRASGATDATLKRIEGYSLSEKGEFVKAKAAMDDYFMEQDPAKVISSDYEYMGKIYAGLVDLADSSGVHADYDSLACEMCLNAARMDRSKDYLFIEAVKSYTKARMYDKAISAVQEKMRVTGKVEANDWYYLGNAAQKAKRYSLADSAWAKYVERQPNIFQGYLGRARANVALDSTKTTWQAKPFFEDVVKHIKSEEQAKYKVELEEAYFYLGFYSFTKEKDMGMAKCWFTKLKDLNAGTSNTKVGGDMLLTKELKDVAAKDCTLL